MRQQVVDIFASKGDTADSIRSRTRKAASPPGVIRSGVRALSIILAVVFLAGCSQATPPEPPVTPTPVKVLDPIEIRRVEYDGRVFTGRYGEDCISPDGKYLLAAVLGESEETMSAIPLSREGEPGASGEAITLYSVDRAWTKLNAVYWIPVGWLSNDQCVFIVHGWQNQGEHKGERGSAVFIGDLSAGTASAIAWVDSKEQGQQVDDVALTAAGKLYMRLAQRVYEVDTGTGSARLVRDNLSDYAPLFYMRISPNGQHAVYSVNEEGRRGIFIMDLATGAERPLLPTGETFSFYPAWSPDGKYVAAYTANLMPDPTGEGLEIYSILPGEDGPLGAAQAITVVDVDGNIVKTISLSAPEGDDGKAQEGEQYLFYFDWLADSKHLVFSGGPVILGKWGEVRSKDLTGVFIADVAAGTEPVQVTDLVAIEEGIGEPIDYIFPVASLPDGSGAFMNISTASGQSIWRVINGQPASKAADGWWQTPRAKPYFLDSVAGVIGQGPEYVLTLFGPGKAVEFGEKTGHPMEILAYNDSILVAVSHDFMNNHSVMYVYSMVAEVVQG